MDLVCLSHLRWNFVFQRPHHLLTRAARKHRVFFVEEPIRDASVPHMSVTMQDGVAVAVPHVVPGDRDEREQLRELMDGLVERYTISRDAVLWYYTPMALPWTEHLRHTGPVVYDCMDHLPGFKDAPAELIDLERDLMRRADLVFTGGRSLYEAKRRSHPSVHCFPSSVDVAHFKTARTDQPSPPDQAVIPGPRIGYFGVLDERIDWPLIRQVAAARPGWQLVLVGPTAKLDPEDLPRAANIHYLGPRAYAELPAYLSGWDVAMMPFARNEATRYISPTKTPEYLAGGRPVASTSIRDVVELYGDLGLVHIGDGVDGFLVAVTRALDEDVASLRARADAYLSGISWEMTWAAMESLIDAVIGAATARPSREGIVVHAIPPALAGVLAGAATVDATLERTEA